MQMDDVDVVVVYNNAQGMPHSNYGTGILDLQIDDESGVQQQQEEVGTGNRQSNQADAGLNSRMDMMGVDAGNCSMKKAGHGGYSSQRGVPVVVDDGLVVVVLLLHNKKDIVVAYTVVVHNFASHVVPVAANVFVGDGDRLEHPPWFAL